MKIIGNVGVDTPALAPAGAAARVEDSPRSAPAGNGELQSAVLQPAIAALRELPEIDHDKVAALREALARGEIPFDATKLAGLVERFHGSRS